MEFSLVTKLYEIVAGTVCIAAAFADTICANNDWRVALI